MTRRILVPLDGSVDSESVLGIAQSVARSWGPATLRLLHVAPFTQAVVADGRVVSYADQETDRARTRTLAYLHAVAAHLDGVEAECVVRFGEPVEAILEEARASGADCVAMATGVTTARSVLNLSVAERVLRAGDLPVLLVHKDAWQAVAG